MMRGGRMRLIALAGVVAALVLVYVAVYGLPGRGSAGSGDPTAGGDRPPAAGDGAEGGSRSVGKQGYSISGDARARRGEVVRLAIQQKPEYLPQLKKAAADPDWTVRHAAVDGVGRLGRDGDPKFLLEVLRNDKEQAQVRAAAAERLGAMRFWDAGPAIIDAMESPSELLRARAGVALRSIIITDLDFRAKDPPARRAAVVERIRQMWPWFYERFAGRQKASAGG